jgi:23S rRNA pseudouridine2605 synthase
VSEGTKPRPKRPGAPDEGERLQKVLSHAGVASRRAAEELMRGGRVWVNGRPATELGMRVDARTAKIEVDGRRVNVRGDRVYLILNKPAGYVTTASDPQRRPTVMDLVTSRERVYPVGRLDADTQGLLILTNDGELAHRLSHPRYRVPRTYLAEVLGSVAPETCTRLVDGVRLDDGPARATSARIVAKSRGRSQVELVLGEGRKREVRRMLEALGHPVSKLVRTRFGPIDVRGLRAGATRALTPAEVGDLHRLVGL